MTVSVVIPVFNEERCIGSVLDELNAAMEWLHEDYEIIVVDDGSSDDTRNCLLALSTVMPTLRVIGHAENLGQSAALLTGVLAARGEWVVTLDGDGQNDPRDIARFLDKRTGDANGAAPLLVIGMRRQRHDDWLRRLSSRVANTVRSRLLGDGCDDSGCGLKLFERDAFLRLPHFDHMHRFLPALFRRAQGSVLSVDVNHRPRLAGRSKYGVLNRLSVGIVDLLGVMWLNRRSCTVAGAGDLS